MGHFNNSNQCNWTRGEEYYDFIPYSTECAKEFYIYNYDELLDEADYHFCPNCGKKINTNLSPEASSLPSTASATTQAVQGV